MLQIFLQDVGDGLREVKSAARHATELINEEHRKLHGDLLKQANGPGVFIAQTKIIIQTLESQLKEPQVHLEALEVQGRFTAVAVEISYRKYRSLSAGFHHYCVPVVGLSHLGGYRSPARSRAVGYCRLCCVATPTHSRTVDYHRLCCVAVFSVGRLADYATPA